MLAKIVNEIKTKLDLEKSPHHSKNEVQTLRKVPNKYLDANNLPVDFTMIRNNREKKGRKCYSAVMG